MLRKSSGSRPSLRATVDNVSYHAYTLWLFTYNDLKTMVFPSTAFAICNALAAYRDGVAANQTGGPLILLIRLPLILLWAWINLLSFAVNNQRHPSALEEDRLNKPWRPVPAGRLTGAQAKSLALVTYPATLLASRSLGGGSVQCVLLALFGYIYNNLKGADVNWLLRNLFNACGFRCFASGALEVASQSSTKPGMIPWLLVLSVIPPTSNPSAAQLSQSRINNMPYAVLIFAYRKPGVSPAEFKAHYETSHVPLVESIAGPLFPKTHTRHYVQRADHGPDYAATVLVGTQADFGYDAIAELVFNDEAAFQAFVGRVSEPVAAAKIAADEEKFLDRAKMRVVIQGDVIVTTGGRQG